MVAVNEWRARIAPATISKQCEFCLRTRVSQSSINYGTAFKLRGFGGGQRSSCRNFVELGPATRIVLTGNKSCSEKGFHVNMAQKLRFGTFLEASHFGPSRSNGMTKCSTK